MDTLTEYRSALREWQRFTLVVRCFLT